MSGPETTKRRAGVLAAASPRRSRRARAQRPAIAGLCAFALAVRPWAGGDASAADPIQVTITASGPNRAYPLGEDFRVEGKPTKVPEQVDLIFVRTAQKFLGVGDPWGESCSDVRKAITDEDHVKDFKKDAPIGRTNVEALWEVSGDGIRSLAVYRASPWKRESEKDTAYALFVPADDFFHPGASYCAFLLETDKQPLVTKGMLEAVTKFVKGWETCNEKEPDKCKPVSDAYLKAIDEVLKKSKLADEDRTTAKRKLHELSNALTTVASEQDALDAATAAWNTAVFQAPQPDSKPAQELNYLGVYEESPRKQYLLAQMIVALLVAHGDLVAVPTKSRLAYYTPDGKLAVTHVSLSGDLSEIRVTGDTQSPQKSRKIETPPAKLPLPGSEITLRDVLELSLGNFKFDAKYLPLKEGYEKELKPALDKNGLAINLATFDEKIGRSLAWLDHLELALSRAWQERPADAAAQKADAAAPKADPFAHPIPTLLRWSPVYNPLREWLETVVLNDCNKIFKERLFYDESQQENAIKCGKSSQPAWPGFEGADPLELLEQTLRRIRAKADDAQRAKDALEKHKQLSRTRVSSEITVASKVDRQAWFGQYVVTTVGIAWASTGDEVLPVNYYGFKVYPWANRVDEPRTALSRDWFRTLSLELALVPNLRAFGPSGRFQGLSKGDIPPLMAGAALQPIPYITVSGGLMFMESRRTVLPQETASLFVAPYFGVAADINILDIAAAALDKGRTTKISALVRQ